MSSRKRKEAPATTATSSSSRDNRRALEGGSTAEKNPAFFSDLPCSPKCRLLEDSYDCLSRISEGTFGIVWKARDKKHPESYVALKELKLENSANGFPGMREINALFALAQHESIVTLKEVVLGTNGIDDVYLVMEYFDTDLLRVIEDGSLLEEDTKSILYQIVSGVKFIHEKGYLHRDLKCSNVLVNHRSKRIAIADFGLARQWQPDNSSAAPLTQSVVSLWYRAPELLFGETKYGPPVDMWSVGCIFGEILERRPTFQSQGELDQISQIFTLLGPPTQSSWPGFDELPNAKLFRWRAKDGQEPTVRKRFLLFTAEAPQSFDLGQDGFDLLVGLLRLDPERRLTASEALEHLYLSSEFEGTGKAGLTLHH